MPCHNVADMQEPSLSRYMPISNLLVEKCAGEESSVC